MGLHFFRKPFQPIKPPSTFADVDAVFINELLALSNSIIRASQEEPQVVHVDDLRRNFGECLKQARLFIRQHVRRLTADGRR